MRVGIVLLLLLHFSVVSGQRHASLAERPNAEELRSEILQLTHSELYVDRVIEFVNVLQKNHAPADSITYWLAKAEYVSDKLSYQAGLRKVYRERGIVYETLFRDYRKALHWYESALRLSITDKEQHELYTSILNLNFYLGDHITAMSVASKGLHMAERAGDNALIAHYTNVIGFIHLRQENFPAAFQSYKSYYSIAMQLRDSMLIADAHNCLAETYLLGKNFTASLDHLFRARSLYEKLRSEGRLTKGDRLPYTLFKIGFAYGSEGKNDLALKYVEEAIDHTRKTSCNLYDVANYYVYAGNLYQQANQYDRSLTMLRSGLSLARSIDHKEDIRDGYLYLHQLYAKTGLFDSAYYYYTVYDKLKDSISNEKIRTRIQQIEASYKVEKKDQEIELLRQQKALQEAASRRKLLLRNLVIIFFVLIAVIIGFLLNRRELRRKNQLQQDINQRQNEMFNLVSSTQDQERKRIAQDLHDGMGTLLSAAKLKLSGISDKEESSITDAIRILDEAVSELRNISHNIMPATLSRIGLVGALQNFFGRLAAPGITFNFLHHGFDTRIDEEKEMILYRVVLELVNNVVKHANASNVTIQLVKYPDHVNLVVEDDGKGIQSKGDHDGIGLTNIASRVQYLKGTFSMDSGTNGTTAIIDVPL